MPELPEVETVRRGLAKVMEGRSLRHVHVGRPDLRIPFPERFAERLTGRVVRRLRRRAKYLLVDCDDGTVLIVHLGMSGRMVIDSSLAAPGTSAYVPGNFALKSNGQHEHVVFDLDDGTTIRFSDPRRFGLMTLTTAKDLARHPLIAHLGPEPTGEEFDGVRLGALLEGKRTPIKAAMLDQRIVAGLGNIYVCESLFASGISPRRMAATVQGDRVARLARAVREVLAEAIAAGGSTLRDHVTPNGEIGYFQHRFKVYDREGKPCPGCDCGGGVRRIVQSGRSTFYCQKRQR
jgi:formamidopyrimidine-DNA glycosylase